MKNQGYVIARNRARTEFFTASSAYDRPQWRPVTEATVYPTAELAQAAVVRLTSHGAYEARLLHVSETFQFELPPQDGGQPEQMEVDMVPSEDGGMEMVAQTQEEPCDVCAHCPCTCDGDTDGVDDIVDAGVMGDEASDAALMGASDLDRLASRIGESATVPAKPQADGTPAPNAKTVVDLKAPETIKYKDAAVDPVAEKDQPGMKHDDKVKVPSEVMSDLQKVIAEFSKCAETNSTRNDDKASFCMTVADAFTELKELIAQGTVESVKAAQIKVTAMMNPISAYLPVSVQKFIHMGGRKPSLKDMFDSKRQEQSVATKATEIHESVHPDIAKKQRIIDRLLASGYTQTHPDVQKLKREIQRLEKVTKGA